MRENPFGQADAFTHADQNAHDQQTLIRRARIFNMGNPSSNHDCADILIKDGIIQAIDSDLSYCIDDATQIIEAEGNLIIPGLINAHFHSPTNFLKGTLNSMPLELFMLYEVPDGKDAAVDARTAYIRTLLGAAEMLKLGVTSVQDDAFFLPYPTADEYDAVMSAYRDSGIRATVALDQPEIPELDKFPFLADLVPPVLKTQLSAAPEMTAEALIACYHDFIQRWHRQENGRLRVAVSCSAPQRVTPAYLAELDKLSKLYNLPFYIHMLETRLQRVFGEVCLDKRSLIHYVDDLGLLSERMNVIHAVWIDDDDIARLARSGAKVIHNPISNLRLGSGVMPIHRLAEAGVTIALGSDEIIADDAVNMWSVMKTAALIHTLSSPNPDHWPDATSILNCMFTGGAEAMLQKEELGRLEVGYAADLVMLDLDTLPFTPLNHLPRQLVYADVSRSVVMTMVAGKVVVKNGQLLTINEAALRQAARECYALLAPKRDALMQQAAERLPFYRAMYDKSLTVEVGMNRWVGDIPAKNGKP
ncbi:5-methylthioadenosine/S-adenosylhomocysteine deaminase [Paramixta manurensis]|uniref:5-methylthioadenosine/S-adenosylhomocysteine deaminase n=1 Tax=Paramixta manurensis TaxID=2740817 RepID=A0A6M8UIZ7_9GAMM|nr:5-methylthioadenosine/S-adenosylhomocysteine deaminase [Erwiniaceae bacterium PD-1]